VIFLFLFFFLTVNGGRGSPPDCIAKLPQMAEFKKVLQLANTCQKCHPLNSNTKHVF
jgi:hypothetical protein